MARHWSETQQSLLLTAQGADATPTVSLMANSSEVFSLGNLHLTLGISNGTLCKALGQQARAQLKTAKFNYLTIVNEDCVFCLDSARTFDVAAKIHAKLGEIRVVSDTPDIEKIKLELGNKKPNVVLLPNYSKSSAMVIAALKDLLLGPSFWAEMAGERKVTDLYKVTLIYQAPLALPPRFNPIRNCSEDIQNWATTS